MSGRWIIAACAPLGLAVFLSLGQAGAEVPVGETPELIEPLPFDHGDHARIFKKAGVSCTDCHPMGIRLHSAESGYTAPATGILEPPAATCHGCHRGEFKGAPRAATGECIRCHANREELVPASHSIGWMELHAIEARAFGSTCSDCHDNSTCTECHEARGAFEKSPHAPGWRTGHGVEARVDPYNCSTCHDGEKCVSCHTTGVVPW